MFIDYEKLYKAGYNVRSDADGMTIEPIDRDYTIGGEIHTLLKPLSHLTDFEREQLVERFMFQVEATQLWNVIKD